MECPADFPIDENGRLDLSPCFMTMSYDMFRVRDYSWAFFQTQPERVTAWDGTPVKPFLTRRKWAHLVCKHNHDKGEMDPINDIDIERVKRLPLIWLVIEGRLEADVIRQLRRGKDDRVEIVTSGPNADYVVVLNYHKGVYILRTAYPADPQYVRKVRRCGTLIAQT